MDSIAEADAPRFLVDHMLGRLVTWLRLLGCDTAYAGTLDDAQIARQAQQEGRIVLTRDRELARRKSIKTMLMRSERLDDQIEQMLQAFKLSLGERDPRCAVCNGELVDLPRLQAQAEVPPYVFQTQARFLRCSGCGRIYWRGTHWEAMQKRLASVAARLEH
jgi:uncharacterized protein with PIN domain